MAESGGGLSRAQAAGRPRWDVSTLFPARNRYRHYEGGQLVDSETDDYDLSSDDEDFIKSILGVWGFNLGFGTEYLFTENFGVSGEYALRLYHTSADRSDSEIEGGGQHEWRHGWEEELSGTLRMTYAAVALTYHFK